MRRIMGQQYPLLSPFCRRMMASETAARHFAHREHDEDSQRP